MKIFFSTIPSIIWMFIFLIIEMILIIVKISPYQELSSLIGIYSGFSILNFEYIEKGTIIFKEGGYDGQFFYFLSKYLFDFQIDTPPVFDSFLFRAHRIGFPILTGALSYFLGFHYYALIALVVLNYFFLFSFWKLWNFLDKKDKYLAIIYLFCPFSLNSNLLLVSDSLLASIMILSYCYLIQSGFDFRVNSFKVSNYKYFVFGLLFLSFLLFIRETAVFLFIPILLSLMKEKKILSFSIMILPIMIYTVFLLWIRNFPFTDPGTNPLSFSESIDYPFFGFVKSLWGMLHFHNFKELSRSISKFPIFLYFILSILNLYNFRKDIHLGVAYILILLIPLVAVDGYWRTFDNISRMFVLITPYLLIMKEKIKVPYQSFGIFYLSFVLFILTIIRIIIIQEPMKFIIF